MTDSTTTRRAEWMILAILAAAQFINMVDFVIVMPLGPQLMRSLSIGPQQFGLIVSSYTITAGLAGVFSALFIDRFDRRTAFLTAFTGFALGTLCCGLVDSYPLLLTARAVTGAFGGALGGMALTIVGDVFPDERRGAATGILMSSFGMASVLGIPLGLKLSVWFDSWHAPFWMLALPSLLVLALAVWQLPSMRRHLESNRPHPLLEIGPTLANRSHLVALALVGTLVSGAFMVVPFLGTYFVTNCGVPEKQLHWVYVAGGAVTLLTSPAIGWLADRWGRFSLYCLLAPLSGVVMATATQMGNLQLGAAALVVMAFVTSVLMVCNSGRMIVGMTMINAAIEPRRRGSFMGLNSAVQHFASGTGAMLGGLIVGIDQAGRLTNFGMVGLAALATSLLSLPLAAGLARRLRVSAEAAAREPGNASAVRPTAIRTADCCDAA